MKPPLRLISRFKSSIEIEGGDRIAALPVSAGLGAVAIARSEVPTVSATFSVAFTATPGTSERSSSA